MPTHCIYGQMTGHCESTRAHELLGKCSKTFYNGIGAGEVCSRIKVYMQTFSSIETFIGYNANTTNGNNKRLINYLQGKSKTLRLSSKF